MSAITYGARLRFGEAIAAFAQRSRLVGTATYRDLRSEEHFRSFAVAGAMKADLLADLREAVRRAVEDGVTLDTFRQDFWAVVQKHGWHGWTGQGTEAGEAWRTRVIYTANLRKSYSAGRYAQLTDPEFLAHFPYWQWVHSGLDVDPRPAHLALHGMTLHHSEPFWRTHFPPRLPPDYGCTCRVKAVRRPAAGVPSQPPAGWETQANPGAGSPPNFVAESIRHFVAMKVQKLPQPEGQALREAVAAYQAARQASTSATGATVAQFAAHAQDQRGRKLQMAVAPVVRPKGIQEKTGLDLEGYAITLDNSGVQHALGNHGNPKTEARRGQVAVDAIDFRLLPAVLANWDNVSTDGIKNGAGRDVLLFDKLIGEIGYRVAMEVRPGQRGLAFNSMRKKLGAWS